MSAPVATADTVVIAPAVARACGGDSMYARVPVYVTLKVDSAAGARMTQALLALEQEVAGRIRSSLGAPEGAVPQGDSLARLDSAGVVAGPNAPWAPGGIRDEGVRVIAHRDGTFRWAPIHARPLPAVVVLDRALTDLQRAGDLLIVGDAFASDSVVFTFTYAYDLMLVDGRRRVRGYGPATLVAFTLRAPVERHPEAVPGTLAPRYPESQREAWVEARMTLQFVIDTNGRAEPSTIHDVWPEDRPRLTGLDGDRYAAFVRSATEAVVHARFSPAERAGCKVRQLVQLPLTFALSR